MDIRQTILDTENAIKDFISLIVKQELGEEWILSSGLSPHQLAHLEERQTYYSEQNSSLSEENRLLNFASFKELSIIIQKNWEGELQVAFDSLEEVLCFFNQLEKFKNPDSQNRPLLVHEKHLVLGISGSLRNRIIVYRSWKEHGRKGFPKIESVQDNFGNLWIVGKPKKLKTKLSLRTGDTLEFVVTAKDPEDMDLEYRIHPGKWQSGNVLLLEVDEKMVGALATVHISIRSQRKHHAFPLGHDDRITFEYEVLPKT